MIYGAAHKGRYKKILVKRNKQRVRGIRKATEKEREIEIVQITENKLLMLISFILILRKGT